MTTPPSIKGISFETAAALARLILEDSSRAPELRGQIRPEDIELIEEATIPSKWYPIESYNRISVAIARMEDRDDPASHRYQGQKRMEEFLGESVYLPFLKAAEQNAKRAGDIVLGMTRLVYNFSKWSFVGDDHSFRITVAEAEPFGDWHLYLFEGFIEALWSHLMGRRVWVSGKRPTPDVLIFEGEIGSSDG